MNAIADARRVGLPFALSALVLSLPARSLGDTVALPFGPADLDLGVAFDFSIDLGSLPARHGIVLSISPPSADAEAELQLIGCQGGSPQGTLVIGASTREIFNSLFATYPGPPQNQLGASCEFRLAGGAGASGSYQLTISAEMRASLTLPFARSDLDLGAPFEFSIDLGSLPARPEISFSISPAAADAKANLEFADCQLLDGTPQAPLYPFGGDRMVFRDLLVAYPDLALRQGVVCDFDFAGASGASGLYQLAIEGETRTPVPQNNFQGAIITPDKLVECATSACDLFSNDYDTEGSNFRWVFDGTEGIGRCTLSQSDITGHALYGYEQSAAGVGPWDCCTWRFDGVDGVTSTIGQLVFENQGVAPPPDGDSDQILDPCDNCPSTPNGPGKGTCVAGVIGIVCNSDLECGEGGKCSLDQEGACIAGAIGSVCKGDADCGANGTCSVARGAACTVPEPSAFLAGLAAAGCLSLLATSKRQTPQRGLKG